MSNVQSLNNKTLADAGVLSRTGKFIIGSWQIYSVSLMLIYPSYFVSSQVLGNFGYWFFVAVAFWVLPPVINIGFRRNWGKKPLWISLSGVLICAAFDIFIYGRLWEMPLRSFIFLVAFYTHTHLGVSHVLAALIATPGCEMRAIPQINAKLLKKDTNFVHCPGFWTPLDEWEARWKVRRMGREIN